MTVGLCYDEMIYKEFPVLKDGQFIKCGIKYCHYYASREVKNGWLCGMHKDLFGMVSLKIKNGQV